MTRVVREPPPAALWRAIALPSASTSPASGRGKKDGLILRWFAAMLQTPPHANAQEAFMTIELHTWNTPNGRKISVALEEMGLPYKVVPVNISKGEQMAPAFLAISPNNKLSLI